MDEVWRDVVGHEGYYQVSSLGRVRSKSRMRENGSWLEGRVLVPSMNVWAITALYCALVENESMPLFTDWLQMLLSQIQTTSRK